MKPPLRDPCVWPARSPCPQEKPWDTDCRNVTCSFTDLPCPPGERRHAHAHAHAHMVIRSQVCHHKAEGKTGDYCTVNRRGSRPAPMGLVVGGQPAGPACGGTSRSGCTAHLSPTHSAFTAPTTCQTPGKALRMDAQDYTLV